MSETNGTGSGARRRLLAGNWKMNGLKAALGEAMAVKEGLSSSQSASTSTEIVICPPATLLMVMAEVLKGGQIGFGGQDCHVNANGAHTGDVSAELVRDAGGSYVIVGHSERRADHGETDALVRSKQDAAHRAGLAAIVCIGETRGQREAGLTLAVVERQLSASLSKGSTAANTVIAYEPVWAIGTGLTPTLDDVGQVHAAIRAALTKRFGAEGHGMRILYGGSVKPDNAAQLMDVPDVDGALVGGASLKAADFLAILAAMPESR